MVRTSDFSVSQVPDKKRRVFPGTDDMFKELSGFQLCHHYMDGTGVCQHALVCRSNVRHTKQPIYIYTYV